jgi:hypothetical protein
VIGAPRDHVRAWHETWVWCSFCNHSSGDLRRVAAAFPLWWTLTAGEGDGMEEDGGRETSLPE